MIKVCVVDDNPLIISTVKRALSKPGYEVLGASGLEEFRSLSERHKFDLVITDYNLEDSTAIDIKDILRNSQTRVLIMTGKDIPEGDEVPCIKKPFSIDELRKMVAELFPGE